MKLTDQSECYGSGMSLRLALITHELGLLELVAPNSCKGKLEDRIECEGTIK